MDSVERAWVDVQRAVETHLPLVTDAIEQAAAATSDSLAQARKVIGDEGKIPAIAALVLFALICALLVKACARCCGCGRGKSGKTNVDGEVVQKVVDAALAAKGRFERFSASDLTACTSAGLNAALVLLQDRQLCACKSLLDFIAQRPEDAGSILREICNASPSTEQTPLHLLAGFAADNLTSDSDTGALNDVLHIFALHLDGTTLDAEDQQGNVAVLMFCNVKSAASGGYVKTLLACGCNPAMQDKAGQNVFIHALKNGWWDVADAMIASPSSAELPVLRALGGFNEIEISSKISSRKKKEMRDDRDQAITKAVDIVKQKRRALLQMHCTAGNGLHCLATVVTNSGLAAAKRLIGAGVAVDDANAQGQTPLHLAVLKNNPKMVKVLIESGGADICLAGHSGQTALHIAFGRGMFLTATSLVDGVKTLQPSQQVQAYSAVDNEGCTAFHQLIRACLKSGADKVALDVAVRLLRLVSPAHLNTVDAQGQNLLHLVCSGEATELRLQLANSLLELQVSPLTVAHDGSTAASQASKAVGDKRRDLCKLLDHFH